MDEMPQTIAWHQCKWKMSFPCTRGCHALLQLSDAISDWCVMGLRLKRGWVKPLWGEKRVGVKIFQSLPFRTFTPFILQRVACLFCMLMAAELAVTQRAGPFSPLPFPQVNCAFTRYYQRKEKNRWQAHCVLSSIPHPHSVSNSL